METPFLDQLIEDHQNHIESVEASSYAGIPETRKQLAELEAIKAIIVTHCSTELKGNKKLNFQKWKELNKYTRISNRYYKKGNSLFDLMTVVKEYKEYESTF